MWMAEGRKQKAEVGLRNYRLKSAECRMGNVVVSGRWSGVSAEWGAKYFFIVKVSPERVAMREGKAWKNRRLASGIATQVLLAVRNFLGVARRARKKNSDRWNNVWAEGSENMAFSRVHCATTVPCSGGCATKTEMKRSKNESQCFDDIAE